MRDAVALVPGAQEGSISVVLGRRKVESQAPSSDLPRIVDALQEETGQGPCLDAVYQHETVRVDDLASEERWPDFSRRASEAGAAAMMSFQLYVDGDNLGALNLYAREAFAFDDESQHVGQLLASHAAVAFAGAKREAAMARGLQTRQVVGQAQGILMERHKLTAHQAFAVLVRTSQDSNLKLVQLAQRLVDTGELQRPRP